MKKSVKVVEVENEGLISLLDTNVILMCMNYFYTGKLVGVNETCVLLEDPKIIYETGEWSSKDWKDAQKLPSPFYVNLSAIESFGSSGK